MFKVICIFLVAAITLGTVTAIQAQVRAMLASEPTSTPLLAGAKFTAQLNVAIDPGWHIASITQPDGGPVRTEITLAPNQPFKFAGPITGPKPHVEHSEAFGINVETHEGTASFTLPLEATAEIQAKPKGSNLTFICGTLE